MLNREQILDVLNYIGSPKIINKEGKDDIQFCCPIHGESNPSAGVSISKQQFNCFSCHEHGGIDWLLYRSLPNEFNSLRDVDEWLRDRYGVDFKTFEPDTSDKIIRYEDMEERDRPPERVVLPRYKLAPFMSGKATYKYFFQRGFTKKTMRERLIGYDKKSRTVTVPVFWEDGELAGILGRYIDPDRPKNKRYKIYQFSTGEVLYGMDKIDYSDRTCILCEGLLDGLWLYQNGFINALATLTNNISKTQRAFLRQHFDTIIDFSDCDEMGDRFTRTLMKYCKDDFDIYSVKHLYPKGCKDPQDCSCEQIMKMLARRKLMNGNNFSSVKSYED